jgi:transaldolase
MNKLDQLRKMTTVVADTGELAAIRAYQPQDATTNPTLLLKAIGMPDHADLMDEALQRVHSGDNRVAEICDWLGAIVGKEILSIVPGRVSTELDARLSFSTEKTVEAGLRMLERYDSLGVDPSRVLLKIASTWEGIRAAEVLEKRGIHCNLTLLFAFAQAQACADAGVFLISPFVGRITDWYKKAEQRDYAPQEDPGVVSVQNIWRYFKRHGYDTIVMGASFRSQGQVEALAGCDYLTIGPNFLEMLQQDEGELSPALDPASAGQAGDLVHLDEPGFRWAMNEDAMATEKLAEGIRNFAADQVRLEQMVASRIA